MKFTFNCGAHCQPLEEEHCLCMSSRRRKRFWTIHRCPASGQFSKGEHFRETFPTMRLYPIKCVVRLQDHFVFPRKFHDRACSEGDGDDELLCESGKSTFGGWLSEVKESWRQMRVVQLRGHRGGWKMPILSP